MKAHFLVLGLLVGACAWEGAWAQAGASAQADGGIQNEAPPDVSQMPFTNYAIRKVVEFHLPKIQGCYEESLAPRRKVVEGRLMAAWIITPEGTVKKAKILKKGTTLRDAKLHECVIAVLSGMSFPKPSDGRDHPVEHPFNLKAIK